MLYLHCVISGLTFYRRYNTHTLSNTPPTPPRFRLSTRRKERLLSFGGSEQAKRAENFFGTPVEYLCVVR